MSGRKQNLKLNLFICFTVASFKNPVLFAVYPMMISISMGAIALNEYEITDNICPPRNAL